MTREDYVRKFEDAGSEREWNALLSAMKGEHGGQYPDWWYGAMIATGIVDRKAREFGAEMRFTIG